MSKANRLLFALLCLLSSGAALPQGTPTPEGMKERANMRNTRYCEILVVNRHGFTAAASVYNTLGLNDCPEEQWKALDAEKIKKERKAYMVVMNGPRYFVMDRNALMKPGSVDDFDGLQARLLATLEMNVANKREPYKENTVERQSQYVYEAGKNVYELHAPDGKSYIMQSYSLEVDPKLNEARLADLGKQLKLPKGWSYQVMKLDQEMVVRNSGTKAYVVQDDLKDSYQRLQ